MKAGDSIYTVVEGADIVASLVTSATELSGGVTSLKVRVIEGNSSPEAINFFKYHNDRILMHNGKFTDLENMFTDFESARAKLASDIDFQVAKMKKDLAALNKLARATAKRKF